MSATLENHDRTEIESLDFLDFCTLGDRSPEKQWRELRSAIVPLLRRYPYFVLVKRLPISEDGKSVRRLSMALGQFHPDFGWLALVKGRLRKEDIARVAIDENLPRRSASASAMAPHTDGAFLQRPHDIIMFQCVVADTSGGESILLPIDDILGALTQRELGHLKEQVFPFGSETASILTGQGEDRNFRYYGTHMERSSRKRDIVLPQEIDTTIKKLDQILDHSNSRIKYKMAPEDILILNNKKVLHGRTALTEQSNRLLVRSRIFSEHV